MGKAIQLIRGTCLENHTYIGPVGSLSYVTDCHGVRVHDGIVEDDKVVSGTPGGFDIPVLVAYQYPDISNKYTWYRKYSDGWVEQGGMGEDNNYTLNCRIYLPIEFKDNTYFLSGVSIKIEGIGEQRILEKTSKYFTTGSCGNNIGTSNWFACGYAKNI